MRLWRLLRHAVTGCAATAMLAGCGGSQPPIGAPSVVPQGSATVQHTAHGQSWLLPEASGETLLYISSYEGAVYIYSYPSLVLVGTLRERGQPQAPCSDANGNVWIPVSDNGARSYVAEYAHGGTKRLSVLRGFGPTPRGCAVNGVTGDVAVTTFCSAYVSQYCYEGGSVSIFKRGKGRPHRLNDSKIGYYWSCAYDDSGNLFVDGLDIKHRSVVIGRVRHGQSHFANISLSKAPAEVGGLQWNGGYLAIEDPSVSTITRFSIKGEKGQVAGTTPINGGQYITGFTIQGSTATVPDYSAGIVGLYDYPQGGAAVTTIAVTLPTGVTLSIAPIGAPH